jgi:hypothetical protein
MAKQNRGVAESWSYVLQADRALEPDQQTRFTLRPVIAADRDRIRDNLMWTQIHADGSQTKVRRTRQTARVVALEHIVSVDNFPVGAPLPWPKDRGEREAYLAMFDDNDIEELGDEIWARSTIGPDEEPLKNSFTPERMSASGDSSAAPTSTTAPPAREIPA